MRGELKITAAKAPFRRGGLSFHAGQPTIVHLGDLDGQRLRALLTEPRLTILADRGDGFEPMPVTELADLDVEQLQDLIDRYAADRPAPVPAPVPEDFEALKAQIEQLTRERDEARAEVDRLAGELAAGDAAIAELAALKTASDQKAVLKVTPDEKAHPKPPGAKKAAPATK